MASIACSCLRQNPIRPTNHKRIAVCSAQLVAGARHLVETAFEPFKLHQRPRRRTLSSPVALLLCPRLVSYDISSVCCCLTKVRCYLRSPRLPLLLTLRLALTLTRSIHAPGLARWLDWHARGCCIDAKIPVSPPTRPGWDTFLVPTRNRYFADRRVNIYQISHHFFRGIATRRYYRLEARTTEGAVGMDRNYIEHHNFHPLKDVVGLLGKHRRHWTGPPRTCRSRASVCCGTRGRRELRRPPVERGGLLDLLSITRASTVSIQVFYSYVSDTPSAW